MVPGRVQRLWLPTAIYRGGRLPGRGGGPRCRRWQLLTPRRRTAQFRTRRGSLWDAKGVLRMLERISAA